MATPLLLNVDKGIATLTLNRPECHNAFNDMLIQLLSEQLKELAHDAKIKILILGAKGENFSAGADLNWMKKMIHFTREENLLDALKLAQLLKQLASFPKPTIALANGMTLGGGVGLLACCDIVIAEETARFCFSEAKLGLVPATIAPYVIQAIGRRAAQYYFLTAKMFSAQEAKQIGLLQEIASKDKLINQGTTTAHSLLKNGPNALQTIKQLIVKCKPINETLLQETAEMIATVRASSEAQEGLAAFFEKREPAWRQDETF